MRAMPVSVAVTRRGLLQYLGELGCPEKPPVTS
ncbi:unnamed protein product [Anisakis simplex]|uniref:Uncharacterized protein n=1 Tax=Anisakis simplex TaxID=6269 RepID=A0A3P6QT30_ANISI|nr:unnamed protein product [Anisakis simplex]